MSTYDCWENITTDSLAERKALIKKLDLPELQSRILRSARWMPQAVEGASWLFLTLEIPFVDHKKIEYDNLTILLNEQKIITLHKGALSREITERLDASRKDMVSPSFIAAVIIQYSIEQFMPILDEIDDVTDRIEDTMIRNPGKTQLQQMFVYKRQLADLRKVALPLMNMLNGLSNGRYELFDESCEIFARDSYDYTWRVHELIDTMRDLLTSALDMYLSVVSNRMNDVMKRLTLVTTVFMPISFLTGLGGMNFVQMPFHSNLAFIIMIALIVIMPIAMVVYFIKRKWL